MEKTYKRVPFDIELAKKIQAGEIEGRIIQAHGEEVRVLDFDLDNASDTKLAVRHRFFDECGDDCGVHVDEYYANGKYYDRSDGYELNDLFLELPEETPKHEFKPFDKVLVSQNGWSYWIPSFYRNTTPDGYYICMDNLEYDKCIPFAGNEHLVGTTNNPEWL